MEFGFDKKDPTSYCLFATFIGSKPQFLNDGYDLFLSLLLVLTLFLLTWAFSVGGTAWKNGRGRKNGAVLIPGPRGLPILGSLFTVSRGLAHRALAAMAWSRDNTQLMAFSLGSTPVVVASDPHTAREILTSPHFADRPLKQSAKSLMFGRAIGFAPNGAYWRLLRRIASTHLFSPKRILAHEAGRLLECAVMLRNIAKEQKHEQTVLLRKHLQAASLNNMMGSVFGKRFHSDPTNVELEEVQSLVREGFELLGAFNWSDYLPWLSCFYDPVRVNHRCSELVPRVRKLVKRIIQEHRDRNGSKNDVSDGDDFVDVLLHLEGNEKLAEDDMIAVLWEMIFRGTDTTALLTEWVMAELVLNQQIQQNLHNEIASISNSNNNKSHLTDADVAKLPYLQAVVKETLRLHPPGPLLSWARLSTSDVHLSNGMLIPANTTAMVNMWAITHDPRVWEAPLEFRPERFLHADVDVRGGDLRLAPFGAGRRVCPGKNLGLVTVHLWVAELVHRFKWVQDDVGGQAVDLSEVLKLSCEMKFPLRAVALQRP